MPERPLVVGCLASVIRILFFSKIKNKIKRKTQKHTTIIFIIEPSNKLKKLESNVNNRIIIRSMIDFVFFCIVLNPFLICTRYRL